MLIRRCGFLNYLERIVLPDYTKSYRYQLGSNNTNIEIEDKDYLKLFPNPAGDYVIAYYDITGFDQRGLITISDVKGEIIKTVYVNSRENQMLIDLKNLQNGLYFVSLFVNNELLESEKLSKSRHY